MTLTLNNKVQYDVITVQNNNILILLYDENQLDALFILSLFRHSTSISFGHICSPSSVGILHIYNNWYVLCVCVCVCVFIYIYMYIYIYIYIYNVPPDDGLQICPKHVEVD